MSNNLVNLIITFLVLIPAQAIFFNNLVLYNVAVPFVFIYLIVCLPLSFGTNVSTLIGFLTGLAVDIMSDTPGVNALSCTILAFARRPIVRLYTSFEEDLSGITPNLRHLGPAAYMKYLVTMTLAYSAMVFTIEAFQVFNMTLYLARITCSTIYSFVIIYAISMITTKRYGKRL